MLDPNVLKAFCSGFYGYGAPDVPYWFITMEEGGGKTEVEVQTRLTAWKSRGSRELEEIHEFHRAINQASWFECRPKIQKTWAAAIRMVLIAEGKVPTTEGVRLFQRDRLARSGGNTRLSPLFPLPAQSLDHWNYSTWANDATFASRSQYKVELERARIEHLSEAIRKHEPSFVAFFGTSYLESWSRIAGIHMTPIDDALHYGRTSATKFIVCRHPTFHGVPHSHFEGAAHVLRDA